MLHKNLRKTLQYSIFAAAIFAGFAPLTHAADARAESKAPNTQPEPSQPPQQASPAQPTVEPLDDDGTYLV